MVITNPYLELVFFSSCNVIDAKEPISFDFDPIVPKPKKGRRVEWELNKMF
jgi:hypothetical protein